MSLELWNKVCKSDPKYLKKVSFGQRSFTAIDPQYQIRSATDQFGPVGEGWGEKVAKREAHLLELCLQLGYLLIAGIENAQELSRAFLAYGEEHVLWRPNGRGAVGFNVHQFVRQGEGLAHGAQPMSDRVDSDKQQHQCSQQTEKTTTAALVLKT